MAFDPANLSRIGYANGNSVFAYKSADAPAVVLASGYFNTSANDLMQGDLILAQHSTGGTRGLLPLLVTSADRAATVTTRTVDARILNVTGVLTNGDTCRIVSPIAGVITRIDSVLLGAITSADAIVTFKINGTAITTGVLTIATAGSAAGNLNTCAPTAANVVAVGQEIKATVSNTPLSAASINVSILVIPA